MTTLQKARSPESLQGSVPRIPPVQSDSELHVASTVEQALGIIFSR